MKMLQKLATSLMMFVMVFGLAQAALMPTSAMAEAAPVGPKIEEIPDTGLGKASLPAVIGSIVKAVLGVTGILLFVLFFYAGFKILTARGNEEEVEAGKKIMMQAILGLLVVLVSYAAATFVLDRLLNATAGTAIPTR